MEREFIQGRDPKRVAEDEECFYVFAKEGFVFFVVLCVIVGIWYA